MSVLFVLPHLPLDPSPPDRPPPDRPKFRSFFPSPAPIVIHSSLSWGSSREFWWCFFESRDPQMCTFGLSGPGFGAAGASHDSPRTPSKREHLRAPALQNTTKIPREDPQETERQKEQKWSGRGKKKTQNWPPPGPPPFGLPTVLGPHFCNLGQKWTGQKWTGPKRIGQKRSQPFRV